MNIEALADRYVAIKEIEKIMSKHTFLHLQLKNRVEWETLWCKETPEPTLTTNHGTYRGYDEIFAWYVADFEKRAFANDQTMQNHYDILQKFQLDDIHGVGTFLVDTFTTPIIELAEDMETAKGWFCGSAITTDIVDGTPQARWTWKKYGIDFVHEDGTYKIWHLKMLTEFSIKPGGNWISGSNELPFGALPSDTAEQYAFYSPTRVPENNPPIPVPYRTFSETFCY